MPKANKASLPIETSEITGGDARVRLVLKDREEGVTVVAACRKRGIPRATFYRQLEKMAAGSSTPERPELVETQIPTTGDDTRGLGADAEAIGA
jgi:hypothetical protein